SNALPQHRRRLPYMVSEEGVRRNEKSVDDDERQLGTGPRMAVEMQRKHAAKAMANHELRPVGAYLFRKPRSPVVVRAKALRQGPVQGNHVDASKVRARLAPNVGATKQPRHEQPLHIDCTRLSEGVCSVAPGFHPGPRPGAIRPWTRTSGPAGPSMHRPRC